MEQKPLEAIAGRFWCKSGKVCSNYCSSHNVSFKWLLKMQIEKHRWKRAMSVKVSTEWNVFVFTETLEWMHAITSCLQVNALKKKKILWKNYHSINKTNLWCAYICEVASHLAGTRFEAHGLESPCGSKALSITRSSESCCHVSVVKTNAAGTYKRTKNTNMLWKCARLPIRNTVGLPAVLLPGSLSRRLMTEAEASPRACGEGKEGLVGGGRPEERTKPPAPKTCTHAAALHVAAPLESAAKVLIIPQIRLTALIFTIGHPVSRITLIPPSFICPIPCRLSGDVRQETKHQDLKARRRPSLTRSSWLPPLSPSNPQPPTHPPLLLCLSPSYSI